MKVDITIIGGDTRLSFAKGQIEKYFKLTYLQSNDLNRRLKNTDYVLLPIPYCRNEKIVGTNYSKEWLNYLRESINPSTVIFAGKIDQYFNECLFDFIQFDYLNNRIFINKNAELTAKGTIENLEKENQFNRSNKVLVIGWGRIGKNLCQRLLDKGIEQIFVLSTTPSKKSQIEESGYVFLNSIEKISAYNLIINTAPVQVLTQRNFALINDQQLIIELASGDGGFPSKHREKYQLNVVDYPGIPGKQYPKQAGIILGDAIIEQIEAINQEIIEGGTITWILNN